MTRGISNMQSSSHQYNGFTLLELLIVIVIITIVSSVISLTSFNRHNVRDLNAFANLLKAQMQVAREQAILTFSIIGLLFDERDYAFYAFYPSNNPPWIPLHAIDQFWHAYPLPVGIHLSVDAKMAVALPANVPTTALQPQIIFYPSGDVSAAVITLSSEYFTQREQMLLSTTGSIVLQTI